MQVKYPNFPPWILRNVQVDLSLANEKKDDTAPYIYIDKFNNLKEKYRDVPKVFE